MWYSQKLVKLKKYSVLILTVAVAHSSHEAPDPIMSGLAFLEQGWQWTTLESVELKLKSSKVEKQPTDE